MIPGGSHLNLVVLNAVGRSGSSFLHGLFDRHPQVLAFPISLDFYSCWRRLHMLRRSWPVSELIEAFFEESNLRYLLGDFDEYFAYLDSQGKPTALCLDRDRFGRELEQALNTQRSLVSRRDFLIALHLVYSKLMGRDSTRARVILLHEHAGFPYRPPDCYSPSDPVNDFAEAKFLFAVREPKNSYASLLGRCARYHPIVLGYHIYRTLFVTTRTARDLRVLAESRPRQVYVCSTERLNSDSDGVLVDLTRWMGVDFCHTMRESTFAGRSQERRSGFGGKEIARFDKIGLNEVRWKGRSSDREFALVEHLFEDLYDRIPYERAFSRMGFWETVVKVLSPDRKLLKMRYATVRSRLLYFASFGPLYTRVLMLLSLRESRSRQFSRVPRWKVLSIHCLINVFCYPLWSGLARLFHLKKAEGSY